MTKEVNPTGIELIAAERERQVSQEGWRPDHDDGYETGELALAAVCYATPKRSRAMTDDLPSKPRLWPWEVRWWKPTPEDRVRELIKAGALIAAEIDRLQRKKRGG